jgi:hypothetical protein
VNGCCCGPEKIGPEIGLPVNVIDVLALLATAISSLDPCLMPFTRPRNSVGVDMLLLNASDTSTPFSVTVIGTY